MALRGVRGAINVHEDSPEAVLAATRRLLRALCRANPRMETGEIASVIFTVTSDLCSVHPARAARQLGWQHVPLLCAQEIPVPNSLPRVIRVLLHWNTELPQEAVRHVYLGETQKLRPDLEKVASL